MATKELKTTPKISVKIWRPVLDKLNEKLESASLRRDAYLSNLLKMEVEDLDKEVSLPNSQDSYNFVFSELDKLDRKLVSLALPLEISARLNEVCSKKRIVRDAFFNRLFLLLAATPTQIDKLFFNSRADWRRDVWLVCKDDPENFRDSFDPFGAVIDPFWTIRAGMDLNNQAEHLENYCEPSTGLTVEVRRGRFGIEPLYSLYTTVFHKKYGNDRISLIGLSCYLPDFEIPGHEAEQAYRARLDELII